MMVLSCRLPMQVQRQTLRDQEIADSIGSTLLERANTIMAIRQTLVQRGVPVQDATRQALATHVFSNPFESELMGGRVVREGV